MEDNKPNVEAVKKLSTMLEFIHDVGLMRFHQKAFFKTHERTHLQSSKELEKKVDQALSTLWPSQADIEKQKQQKLF